MKNHTCVFTGRLGNNLFQLANLISYSLKHNVDFMISTKSKFWVDGVKVDYFVPFEIFNYNYNQHILSVGLNYFKYNPRIYNFKKHPFWLRYFNVQFDGHYLSYKYFEDIKSQLINKYFHPNNYIKNVLADFNPSKNSVGISVRRGDFLKLQELHTVIGVDYYLKSLNCLNQLTDINEIYVFSDDLDWCRNNFNDAIFHQLKSKKIVFVDDEIGIQLFKMTKLSNLILSNSTFAWWGAYLNENVHNVIYPLAWFGPKNANKFSFDLFPCSWKGIK
jgi:hypothetical protein